MRPQGCTKAEQLKFRLPQVPEHMAETWALSSSPSSVLPSTNPTTAAHSPLSGRLVLPNSQEGLEALLDAGRLLGRLLDSLARALTGRQHTVSSHAEALLGRLFPTATSITATLPSADGQGLAVTTLLHAAAAPGGHQHHPHPHHHTELLGNGVCSFHLATPPTAASLRLMHALMDQLAIRLKLEGVVERADATLAHLGSSGAPTKATGKVAADAHAHFAAAAAAPPSAAALGSPAAMPADCFWMSV